MTASPSSARRRRAPWIAMAIAAAIVVTGAVAVAVFADRGPGAVAPAPSPAPPSASAPTPSATPTETGFPADTAEYPLDALPVVEVFAIIPALPVDADPYGPLTGEVARAAAERIPVFADPTGEPVATLPRDHFYEGTTVPIIERQQNWVHVLLTGRAAVPSTGSSAQLTGWVRAADVEVSPTDVTVETDLTARTVDIVRADGTRERIADDFAWGTDATPTPRGRSFVMMVRAEPSLGYTRGHPLVYLSVQSPTLDGFGGTSVAVTAFHYHDTHSGPVSNGCLRLPAEAIDRLAQVPAGTPVVIR
ncbi:L,D-transpeptidase family protein [Microbacterium sp. RD1]|uniref:L,D-transpeptidase family protein n=1 Tax=Microbacterium sp. RD1 TaxID=3457313 RepID=UPI003FA5F56B